jgi:hypothetical protein
LTNGDNLQNYFYTQWSEFARVSAKHENMVKEMYMSNVPTLPQPSRQLTHYMAGGLPEKSLQQRMYHL